MIKQYPYSMDFKGKKLNFRKWKVKDKNKILAHKDDPIILKEALVFDCLENKQIGISTEEYNYILTRIREKSLSYKIQYKFQCDSCANYFNHEINLNEVITSTFSDYSDITFDTHTFKMHDIPNRDFYEKAIANKPEAEIFMLDFFLHIKSYNDNEAFSLEDITEIINELDVEDFEMIIDQWNKMKFTVDKTHLIQCPHCEEEELYIFDSMPGFFPSSWKLE